MANTASGKPPYKERSKRDKWYPGETANNISCAISDSRKMALDRMAYRMNTTVGSITRRLIEETYSAELDEIEATL